MSSASGPSASELAPEADIDATLREVIETLAPLDRTPCSAGERAAAEWLHARLAAIDGVQTRLEDEPSWGAFPPTSTGLGLLGMAGAALALGSRRWLGVLLAAVSCAGIIDEAQNGPRLIRRAVRRRRTTVNVVARVGERDPAAQGEDRIDTLVVLAHHDAPQTGFMFDQTLQRRLHELAPRLIERMKTSPPQWWIGLAGPLCTLVAAASRRRGPAWAGIAVGVLAGAIVIDVWRSQTVPGANDNLSGVAVLVALAELLRERPVPGVRVLLVSCGAEETLQDGIRAFVDRHRDELPLGHTSFVNLDTVGSPHLVMLEGEGPIWMEEYAGAWLRDLIAERAQQLEIPLERGFRARASNRQRHPQSRRLSDSDARVAHRLAQPRQLPPAERHPGQSRLCDRRPRHATGVRGRSVARRLRRSRSEVLTVVIEAG